MAELEIEAVRRKLHGGSQLTADDIVLLESEHGREVASYHKALQDRYEEIISLRDRIVTLEKGLRAIEPRKLREIAEWFDLIDKLLDKLEVNGAPFREQYAMPRKSDIQDDLRSWAETVEALVGAALGGEDG